MHSAGNSSGSPNLYSELPKWMTGPRLKDVIPLPEGWLDYFFTTVNVVSETGCVEKQCKVAGCLKKYKGSNGITSNFAKHIRKNHITVLKQYAEQNRQWKMRNSDRNFESVGRHSTLDSSNELRMMNDANCLVINSEMNDEVGSESSGAVNDYDSAPANSNRCDEQLQQNVVTGLPQPSVTLNLKPNSLSMAKVNFINNGTGTSIASSPAQSQMIAAIDNDSAPSQPSTSVRNVNLNSLIAPNVRKRKLTKPNEYYDFTSNGTCHAPVATASERDCNSDSEEQERDVCRVATRNATASYSNGVSQKPLFDANWDSGAVNVDSSLQVASLTKRLMKSALDLMRVSNERDKDDLLAFGNLVVSEMRTIADDRLRDSLKMKIMSLIYETKHSNNQSSLLPPKSNLSVDVSPTLSTTNGHE